MKKLLLNALFMGLATLGFAQPKFTEQTLTEVHQAFITDGLKAVAERTSPDFMMIGSNGQTRDYAGFKALNESGGIVEWPVSEVKITQAGNLAIVTSISNHAAVFKQTNAKFKANERSTEVFDYQNGKWMYKSAHYTNIQAPEATEEAAIKKLLVDERKAFHAGDKEGMEKMWKTDSKSFVRLSGDDGGFFHLDNEGVKKAIAGFKPNDLSAGNITDSKVYMYGNYAVADMDMTVTLKNGSSFNRKTMVHLEKDAGTWKVLGHDVHDLHIDKKADEAAIKAVIEKETQAFHDRDAAGRIACIANVPYAVMLVHHGVAASNNGVAYVTNEKTNAPEMIKTQTEGMGKPNGSTFKNENYVVTIKGGTAFVSYTEVTTAADGTKGYGHAVRNLERIDGLWKLTYIGGVVYKP
jgi:hypothetical protein